MFKVFPNDIISDYFKEIRNLLYRADGRKDSPPENLFEFNREFDIKLVDRENFVDLNQQSKILVSPNIVLKDLNIYQLNISKVDYDIEDYNKDFLTLPFEIKPKQVQTEIAFYFYLYSQIGIEDPAQQALIHSIILKNIMMRRSDFLFMMMVRKFENIANQYQNCLKGAVDYFQFKSDISEEIILKNIIQFYSGIIDSQDRQLSIFSEVKLSKKVADLFAKILFEFFTLKLNQISPDFEKYYVTDPEDQQTYRMIDGNYVYELPRGFSLENLGIKSKTLDPRQTAILFFYLRKYAATIEYTDRSYGKLVYYFSGHRGEGIRKKLGPLMFDEIFEQTKYKEKYFNPKRVVNLLKKIILEIQKDVNIQHKVD